MGIIGTAWRRGLGILALVIAAEGAAAQDGVRMLDGSLTYRERIPLPPDALAVVEARDARGRLLAEATLRTRGRQIPLAFELGLPANLEATVRAAIIEAGRAVWAIADVDVAAGADAVSLGNLVLRRYLPVGFDSLFRCGAREVQAAAFSDNAVIGFDGRRMVLDRVPSASGARFEAPGDPATWFWNRGNSALVSLAGVELPECSAVPPGPARSYVARGNEPGWTLTVADGAMTLVTDYGARTLTAAQPETDFAGGAFVLSADDGSFAVRIAPELCRDDMTGMPYPDRAEVSLDGARLTGCGGTTLDLLTGPEWVVEDIGGAGIVDGSRITLSFDEAGGIGGTAGCNRYATSVAIGGEGVSVGPIAATRMACAEALVQQERAFFGALDAAGRIDFDDSGALLVYEPASADPVLTARR